MLDLIDPTKNDTVRSFLARLAERSRSIQWDAKANTHSRYAHIYGELKGQRSANLFSHLERERSADDTDYDHILALEGLFALFGNVISASALSGHPIKFLASLRKTTAHKRSAALEDISSGKCHADFGLRAYKDLADFTLEREFAFSNSAGIEHIIRSAEAFWGNKLLCSASDPMQLIHDRIFPKDLCHVTGQFYTPHWLSELLLEDLSVTSESTVTDPFCGSGAFLIAALRAFRRAGLTVEEANDRILGIDLSPSACLAARTNIVLDAVGAGLKDFSRLRINVICADALAPAVTQGLSTHSDLLSSPRNICVDGEVIQLDPFSEGQTRATAELLEEYGFCTDRWIRKSQTKASRIRKKSKVAPSPRARRIAEQLAVYSLAKASIVATNPPWVGWEYIARPYRSYLDPAWGVYGLFEQKGLEAAFLKEDLSTLCVATACDRYLDEGGAAALLLRPATMQSELAARGLRRLRVFPESGSLQLLHVREFGDLKLFGNAATHAISWNLIKGTETHFPVPLERWTRSDRKWQSSPLAELGEIRANVQIDELVCAPIDSQQQTGRWSVSSARTMRSRETLLGTNAVQPRIGFFTGGANAVYYIRRVGSGSSHVYENITERAKRKLPTVRVTLEPELVYQVLRGRDIGYWRTTPAVSVLCPHTRETKMYPIQEVTLNAHYPKAYKYLQSMKSVLEQRNGFTGWEKKIHKAHFYTLQRLGEYSFAPFKVCWKYIASDFIVAVVASDASGKPILPNDKVVFVPFEDAEQAYFFAGVISSSPIRHSVVTSASSRQISASVLNGIAIPNFNSDIASHKKIASLCVQGHSAVGAGDLSKAQKLHAELDRRVAEIFGLSRKELADYVADLKKRQANFPFSAGPHEDGIRSAA